MKITSVFRTCLAANLQRFWCMPILNFKTEPGPFSTFLFIMNLIARKGLSTYINEYLDTPQKSKMWLLFEAAQLWRKLCDFTQEEAA